MQQPSCRDLAEYMREPQNITYADAQTKLAWSRYQPRRPRLGAGLQIASAWLGKAPRWRMLSRVYLSSQGCFRNVSPTSTNIFVWSTIPRIVSAGDGQNSMSQWRLARPFWRSTPEPQGGIYDSQKFPRIENIRMNDL